MKERTVAKGKYIVFGASGLAGSHALKALKDQPDVEVKAVYLSSDLKITGKNIQPLRIDLRNMSEVQAACHDCDYALIYSGVVANTPVLQKNPVAPLTDTLKITANCLEACYNARVNNIVWLSSTTGYGADTEYKTEDQYLVGEPSKNWHLTGWTFRYLENLCKSIAEMVPNPINVTVLRPTMIYGDYANYTAGQSHFLPELIHDVLKEKRTIQIWGDGEQRRDLVYAGDVVQASLLALNKGHGFETYNISSGHSVSVNECIREILDILDKNNEVSISYRGSAAPGLKVLEIPNEKARNKLGFSPSISLRDGLVRTIKWYKDRMDV